MIERETKRNIEVMWLVNRVSPTYKTIAAFAGTMRQPLLVYAASSLASAVGSSYLAMNYWLSMAPGSRR
jgi:hypothetical protein